jgi:hypothetical protein
LRDFDKAKIIGIWQDIACFKICGNNLPRLKASTFINTLILSQHEGAQCLDDTTHIVKDKALRLITNQSVPTPQAIGIWLRRLGKDNQGIKALQKVNKTVLKATLNHCKNITLDILDSNNSTQAPEQITTGQYIYRSIATNLETLSDSKVIH